MYAPYVVPNHPNIPTLGYIFRSPIRLTYYMLPNLLPTKVRPHSSWRMSEHRRIMSNQRSNLMNKRRRDTRRRRELGGVIAPKDQDLVDMYKN